MTISTYKKPDQKPYFYNEGGKTKRYIYCSLCLKGPFKEEQLSTEIFYICGSDKIYYCSECKKNQKVIEELV